MKSAFPVHLAFSEKIHVLPCPLSQAHIEYHQTKKFPKQFQLKLLPETIREYFMINTKVPDEKGVYKNVRETLFSF